MTLLIDASNILAGGGVRHLVGLLSAFNPYESSFSKIIVCAPSLTLALIAKADTIEKHSHDLLDGGYIARWRWRRLILPHLLRTNNAFLFALGGIKPPFDWPYVTVCQNLLPLDYKELFRYGFSLVTLRLLILRRWHLSAYKRAVGTVFLTRYCYDVVYAILGGNLGKTAVVPHGLDHRHFQPFPFKRFSKTSQIFQLLYISIIDIYKHQDKVSMAVLKLNKQGHRVNVTFVGPAYAPSKRRLDAIIRSPQNRSDAVHYISAVPYNELNSIYKDYHAFVFASTCETFGMIVTEAMAMGMPLLCSNHACLKETVGDAAIYIDPTNVISIEQGILAMMEDEGRRAKLSSQSLMAAKRFTWQQCANETFAFLSNAAKASGF